MDQTVLDPIEYGGAVGQDGDMGVAYEYLSGMQAQRVRRQRSTPVEVIDDLVYPVVVAGDCVFARNVPLDLIGQQCSHSIHLTSGVHGVLRIVQRLQDR